MRFLNHISRVQGHTFQFLYGLADEVFDKNEPHLCFWDGARWKRLSKFYAPHPQAMVLCPNRSLFLASGPPGIIEISSTQEWSEYPVNESRRLNYRDAKWLKSQELILLCEVWNGETLEPQSTEWLLFSRGSGLVPLAHEDITGMYGMTVSTNGDVFAGGRSALLKLAVGHPPRPTNVSLRRLETGISQDMFWNSLAISSKNHLYAGGEAGVIARAIFQENGDYSFEFLSMGRDDCAIDQLVALPDNLILCAFAGRLYCIRGLTPEDITPPSVEHVTCVAAASDGLVVGTLEQGVWVGPPWRQLPPIEFPD